MVVIYMKQSFIMLSNFYIIVGDQLTCKNIRASKLWRQPEVDVKDRLTWANELQVINILEFTPTIGTAI